MREILFRGKDFVFGNWVEGFYFTAKTDQGTVVAIDSGDEVCQVIPETVGQYTGLADKNGKKIFEGDVVVVYDAYCNETVVGIVYFDDGSFCIRDADCTSYDRWMRYRIEVIGNIYDNPELMGGNK